MSCGGQAVLGEELGCGDEQPCRRRPSRRRPRGPSEIAGVPFKPWMGAESGLTATSSGITVGLCNAVDDRVDSGLHRRDDRGIGDERPVDTGRVDHQLVRREVAETEVVLRGCRSGDDRDRDADRECDRSKGRAGSSLVAAEVAQRQATGDRDACGTPGERRGSAIGPMSITPARTATMPTRMSTTWTVDSALSALPPMVRHTVPPMSSMMDSSAERCSRAGRGGRPDRATTVGMRDIARPGHHAAPVAVSDRQHRGRDDEPPRDVGARRCDTRPLLPFAAPARPNRPRRRQRRGAAETIPVTRPVATIVNRRCFSVAPTADIIPSCGSRRWAMTVKLAAATSATRSRTTVVTTSTIIAAMRLSGASPRDDTSDRAHPAAGRIASDPRWH